MASPTSGSSAKFAQGLPKSAFAWVDANGNGHLPYKNKDGSINLAHTRNALARASQVNGLSGEELQKVIAKLRGALQKAKAASEQFYLVDMERAFAESEPVDDKSSWVEAFVYSTWLDNDGDENVIDREFAEAIKKNFDENKRGIDLAVGYEHGTDPARGKEAAGWVRGMNVLDDKMEWLVEWTEDAKKAIKERKFKYFSPEWFPQWVHNKTQEVIDNIAIGGTLTNRPIQKGIAAVNFAEVLLDEPTLEFADWEHHEPGTDAPVPGAPGAEPMAPPPPNMPPDPKPLTHPPEGRKVDEAELRKLLGIGEDADINATITKLQEDAKAFAEADKEAQKKRKFAEDYPEEYAVQQELLKKAREADSKDFAESFARVKLESGKEVGLPPTAVDKVKELHKAFSEGTADVATLKDAIDEMLKHGVVKYGEVGTSRPGAGADIDSPQDAVKEFAERMTAIQREAKKEGKEISPGDALAKAASEMPEHYEIYRNMGGGVR